MELNYDMTLSSFNKYIDKCKKRIMETFFSEEELNSSYYVKSDLLKKGNISPNISVSDAIKKRRNDMIDTKVNHTMRVVESVIRMSQKMELNVDFEKVLKVSALLHDIGRFEQAIYNNNYIDTQCKMFNGSNHAEYGYQMLYVNNNFDRFLVPDKYKFVISQPVRYHQIPVLKGDLAILFKRKEDLDVSKYVTGSEILNEQEKVIVAVLVQMVKDVDMLDILYQHLTGDYPVVVKSIRYKVCGDSLDTVSKHFGVSPKEIMEYNGLSNDDIREMEYINIPTMSVEVKSLIVPMDIQERFFNNEDIDLKEIQIRRDWSFITGMWWRLNHFLNNINFVSNLELVEENELLEKIYELYPDKLKPLVAPAFEFAKDELVTKSLVKNKGQIYKLK